MKWVGEDTPDDDSRVDCFTEEPVRESTELRSAGADNPKDPPVSGPTRGRTLHRSVSVYILESEFVVSSISRTYNCLIFQNHSQSVIILPPVSASQLEFKTGVPLEFCLKQSLWASTLLMQKLSLVYLSIGLLLVAHDVLSGAEDIDFLVLAAIKKM